MVLSEVKSEEPQQNGPGLAAADNRAIMAVLVCPEWRLDIAKLIIDNFYANLLDSYWQLCIGKVFWRPSWIAKFPPMDFFGTFSMSCYITFRTYSEKISLLQVY